MDSVVDVKGVDLHGKTASQHERHVTRNVVALTPSLDVYSGRDHFTLPEVILMHAPKLTTA